MERNAPAVLFVASFILFSLSVSKSVNVYDFFVYAKMIQTNGFGDILSKAFGVWSGAEGGLSRASFYVALSYPFTRLFGGVFSDEFSLNLFSSLCVALSAVFVFKTLGLYFKRREAVLGTAIYVLMPWVFFNGINATLSSLQLLLTSAWLYFLLSYEKSKKPWRMHLASAALTLNIFTHLSSAPLLIAHVAALWRSMARKRLAHAVANFAILLPAFALIYYFTFVAVAYRPETSMNKIVFSAALLAWESLNSMSLLVFVAFVASFITLLKNYRKMGVFNLVFLLSFVATVPSILVFHYVPIANFTPLFVFVPALAMRFFSRQKRWVLLLAIALLIVKIFPLYVNFHYYPHPHKEYALWLDGFVGEGVVLVGHECPAVKYYTNLTVVCRGENVSVDAFGDRRIFVTSQYFKNENQLELEYAAKTLGIPLFGDIGETIKRLDVIPNREVKEFAVFSAETRKMEDHYQFLYSVYPNPFFSVFVNTDFLKEKYILYEVE